MFFPRLRSSSSAVLLAVWCLPLMAFASDGMGPFLERLFNYVASLSIVTGTLAATCRTLLSDHWGRPVVLVVFGVGVAVYVYLLLTWGVTWAGVFMFWHFFLFFLAISITCYFVLRYVVSRFWKRSP